MVTGSGKSPLSRSSLSPTPAQRRWLMRGLDSVDGRLPLFTENGRAVQGKMVDACQRNGWSEQWFSTKNAPDWQVHRLTRMGRKALEDND